MTAALLLLFFAGLPLVALAVQWALTSRDARRYPAPGRLVMTSAGRLHVRVEGDLAPTVVLDSALAGSSLSWCEVQPRLARVARVVSYDRAGFGWSDPARGARTVARMVSELRELLERGAESSTPPPYVLVGHSYGGWIARLFAALHPDRVAGLVLVDEPDPGEWAEPTPEREHRVTRGARLARRFAVLARFGLARVALHFGPRGRLPSPFVAGATDGERERVVSLLDRVPEELRPVLRSFWSRPSSYRALASQIEHVPESARAVDRAGTPFAAIPLLALTAAHPSPERLRKREALVSASGEGRHVVAARSGHWIPLEEPDLVVAAVLEIVERIRRRSEARIGS